MPRPSKRTRNRKRVNKALPGGANRMEYREKTSASSRCLICGRPTVGLSVSSLQARKLNRGRRRMWRSYGGQICPNCLKNSLKLSVRTL